MPLVRKHDEIHQRGQKGLELVVFVFAEAGVEERFDSADDPGSGYGSLRRRVGKKLLGKFVEAPREIVQEFDTPHNRLRAGSARLDHQRPRGIGLANREFQHRFETKADFVTPNAAALADCRFDFYAQARGAGVEGGEEAVFFVGEMFVEGGAGNAGAIDYILDIGFQVSEFGGGVEHRYDQPLALDRLDQVGRKLPDSRGEFAAAGQELEGGLNLLGWPVVTDRSKEGVWTQLDSLEGHRETHKFVLKTTKVSSRYQNKGLSRSPLQTADIPGTDLAPAAGGSRGRRCAPDM